MIPQLYIFLAGILLLWPQRQPAQDVSAHLAFGIDSFRPGQILPLRLEIQHPADVVVIFPDSGWDFRPFELVTIQPLLTQTTGNISSDAATYSLRTFDLADQVQLRLPYQVVRAGDTLTFYARSDTLALQKRITSLAPPPPFRSETGVMPLKDPPNYLLLAGLALLTVLGLLLAIRVLRKPLGRYLQRRRMLLEWQALRRRLQSLPEEDPVAFLEGLTKAWKDYLAPASGLPLHSLTTTELAHTLPGLKEVSREGADLLLEIARTGDQVIYAGQAAQPQYLLHLREQCALLLREIYETRAAHIRYGQAS